MQHGGKKRACLCMDVDPPTNQPVKSLFLVSLDDTQINQHTHQVLSSLGAPLEDQDVANRTALFWAIQYGRSEVG